MYNLNTSRRGHGDLEPVYRGNASPRYNPIGARSSLSSTQLGTAISPEPMQIGSPGRAVSASPPPNGPAGDAFSYLPSMLLGDSLNTSSRPIQPTPFGHASLRASPGSHLSQRPAHGISFTMPPGAGASGYEANSPPPFSEFPNTGSQGNPLLSSSPSRNLATFNSRGVQRNASLSSSFRVTRSSGETFTPSSNGLKPPPGYRTTPHAQNLGPPTRDLWSVFRESCATSPGRSPLQPLNERTVHNSNPAQFEKSCFNLQATSEDDEDSCWVTLFGYPVEAAQYVLSEFSKYGVIEKHLAVAGTNWMHVRFANNLQAARARSKNGTIVAKRFLIGVLPYQRDLLTVDLMPAEAQEMNQSMRIPASTNESETRGKSTNECESNGKCATESTSAMTKILGFVFGR